MKFYDIWVRDFGYGGGSPIIERENAHIYPDSDTWAKYDDVQKMRARLLVKLLRERAGMLLAHSGGANAEERHLRTSAWCYSVVFRIEEKYRGEK